jgi:F-type H+-transporting ATPase subunit delta
MSITTIARRYAEAVADVATAKNQVEQIDAELNAFAHLMKSNRELYDVFASPVLSNEQKGKVLNALVERMRPSQTIANLLKVMLTNYRLHILDAVYEQFKREINERKGLVSVDVTTAQALGAGEQDLLNRRLQELTGKQVQIHFKTDAALIGGVVTKIGSVEYDGSIRTQLETVKQRLKTGDR